MTTFTEFLSQRLEAGGFTTEDALASFLPLLRQVAAAHRAGLVAPLQGVNAIHVENNRLWFEEAQAHKPTLDARQAARAGTAGDAGAVEVVGQYRVDMDVEHGADARRQPADRQARRAVDAARLPARLRELGARDRPSRSADRHLRARPDSRLAGLRARSQRSRRPRPHSCSAAATCSS